MIRIVTDNEARSWMAVSHRNAENTLILNKCYDYSTGDEADYTFLATLEFVEEVNDEFPDEIRMLRYGNSGWEVDNDTLQSRNGTLMDKLIEEHDHHAGDIYIEGDKDTVGMYLDYANEHDAVFVLCLDKDIQEVLSHLEDGTYCFLFEDEDVVREKYFREQEHSYRIMDAECHIEMYCDNDDVPVDMVNALCDRIEAMIMRYERNSSCEIDENTTWDETVEYEADEIMRNAAKESDIISRCLSEHNITLSQCSSVTYALYGIYSKKEQHPEDFYPWERGMMNDFLCGSGAEVHNGELTIADYVKFYEYVAKKVQE